MERQTSSETAPVPQIVRRSDNGSLDTATLELLASWRLQDATEDPEEIRAAEQELTEFKRAMNENRALAGEHLLYP
jgi:hypothetical protein